MLSARVEYGAVVESGLDDVVRFPFGLLLHFFEKLVGLFGQLAFGTKRVVLLTRNQIKDPNKSTCSNSQSQGTSGKVRRAAFGAGTNGRTNLLVINHLDGHYLRDSSVYLAQRSSASSSSWSLFESK